MDYREEYERKTGEKAIYRKDSSDYHTLKYVKFLEQQLQEKDKVIDAVDIWRNDFDDNYLGERTRDIILIEIFDKYQFRYTSII